MPPFKFPHSAIWKEIIISDFPSGVDIGRLVVELSRRTSKMVTMPIAELPSITIINDGEGRPRSSLREKLEELLGQGCAITVVEENCRSSASV